LRQHDQQFFDTFMLVIGILMGIGVGLFFLVRAISIDTQGLYIIDDPTVQAAIDERIKPVGRVLLMGDAELAAAASGVIAAMMTDVRGLTRENRELRRAASVASESSARVSIARRVLRRFRR